MSDNIKARLVVRQNPGRERGAVLLVSIIILLVLTIVSLSSSQGIVMQEKMTGSSRQATLALMAAESALIEAEEYMEDVVTLAAFNDTGADGFYSEGFELSMAEYFDDANWVDANSQLAVVDVAPDFNGSSTAAPEARWIVEERGPLAKTLSDTGDVNSLNMGGYGDGSSSSGSGFSFRIVARGKSPDGNTVRLIRTFYVKNL